MKAYLKADPSRIGTIYDIYVTDFGQKRFILYFSDTQCTIDAECTMFEVVEGAE